MPAASLLYGRLSATRNPTPRIATLYNTPQPGYSLRGQKSTFICRHVNASGTDKNFYRVAFGLGSSRRDTLATYPKKIYPLLFLHGLREGGKPSERYGRQNLTLPEPRQSCSGIVIEKTRKSGLCSNLFVVGSTCMRPCSTI